MSDLNVEELSSQEALLAQEEAYDEPSEGPTMTPSTRDLESELPGESGQSEAPQAVSLDREAEVRPQTAPRHTENVEAPATVSSDLLQPEEEASAGGAPSPEVDCACVLLPSQVPVTLKVRREISYTDFLALVEGAFKQRVSLAFKRMAPANKLWRRLRGNTPSIFLPNSATQMVERIVTLDAKNLSYFLSLPDAKRKLACRPLYALGPQAQLAETPAQPQPVKHKIQDDISRLKHEDRIAYLRTKIQTLEKQLPDMSANVCYPKPLSKDEEDSCVNRLYSSGAQKMLRRKKSIEEEIAARLKPRKVFSKTLNDSEQRLVDELYEKSRSRKEEQLEQNRQNWLVRPCKTTQISMEQAEESIQRLYNADLERRQEQRAKMETKVYGDPSETQPVQLNKKQMQKSLQSLYSEAVKLKSEKLQKIEEQYSFQTKPTKKIPPAELSAAMDRLYNRAG
eukprot:NODE_214_length_1633_cov_243.870581_g148_i0.p1 GENE.NODE_214_length_1633_cov_243.870581_g148_i0~~NODE_214_length_1633_cov_243.870581_g148_i0.p1  ORF type:complete len:472 (-),score=100.66 NODE_214_length_1633_cov_243.870581_g148_i0:217-1575(-)